jgi:hypothetical protein
MLSMDLSKQLNTGVPLPKECLVLAVLETRSINFQVDSKVQEVMYKEVEDVVKYHNQIINVLIMNTQKVNVSLCQDEVLDVQEVFGKEMLI